MKKAYLVIAILAVMLAGAAKAQEMQSAESNRTMKHNLGIAAGYTMGYGLSYRFQPKKFGVQVTFSPYKDARTTQYSSGLTFVYKVAETQNKVISMIAYESNFYFSATYDEWQHNYNNYPYYYYHISSSKDFFNNGIGVGVEFFLMNGLVFDLMGGYAFYNNFTEYRLTGETGLLFKF